MFKPKISIAARLGGCDLGNPKELRLEVPSSPVHAVTGPGLVDPALPKSTGDASLIAGPRLSTDLAAKLCFGGALSDLR